MSHLQMTTILHLPLDMIHEITSLLDAKSQFRFLCSAKHFWKLTKEVTFRCMLFKNAAEDYDYDMGLKLAVQYEDMIMIELFSSKGADGHVGVKEAAKRGNYALLTHLATDYDAWRVGLEGAARGGHLVICLSTPIPIKHFHDECLYKAAKGGHKEVIEYFFFHLKRPWHKRMNGAARGGHMHLVQQYYAEIKDFYDAMQHAAKGGHRELIQYLVDNGCTKWNGGLVGASSGGHKDLVDFFIQKGADNWNDAMVASARRGNLEMVQFFVKKGATSWNPAMWKAAQKGHRKVVEWLVRNGGDAI